MDLQMKLRVFIFNGFFFSWVFLYATGLFIAPSAWADQAPDVSSSNIQSVLTKNPQLMASYANSATPNPTIPTTAATQPTTKTTQPVKPAAPSLTSETGQAPPQASLVNPSFGTAKKKAAPQPVLPSQSAGNASTLSPDDADLEQEENDSAFKAVLQEAFPLSPDQLKQLHNMLDDTQRAAAADPYDSPPQPTSSSMVVNLAPGSTPPVIRLARGFVSSLVFIDSSGAPWPIQAYDLGNPNAFDIKWNQKDNTLMVQARSGYTYGNLAVVLQDMDTPVMLTLVPGQKVVDYRVDLRVQGLGPHASHTALQGKGMPEQANAVLLSVLDGVAPKGSRKLMVEGSSGEAWVINDKLFVRTRYNLLSPAWMGKMSSADGMNAYELPKTPMILVSRYGKLVQLKIEGF